jgi:hypothetical protein
MPSRLRMETREEEAAGMTFIIVRVIRITLTT